MPDIYYKYTDLQGAQAILSNQSLRMSNPKFFNDPFDMLVDGSYGTNFDNFRKEILTEFFDAILCNPEKIAEITGCGETSIGIVAAIINSKTHDEKEKVKKELLAHDSFQIESIYPSFNDDLENIKKIYSAALVVCVSSLNDNILMWSHYADKHQGCVLGFKPNSDPSVDSALCLFKAVSYSESRPSVFPKGLPETIMSKDYEFNSRQLHSDSVNAFIHTKSIDWSYEKEYRLYTYSDGFEESTYFDLQFRSEELTEVYFGIRMPKLEKNRIAELSRAINPSVKIFSSSVPYDKYQIHFEEHSL